MRTYFIPSPEETRGMDPDSLRRSFLVEELFRGGELRLAYTGLDRLVIGGIVPGSEPLRLPSCVEFGTERFTARREIGVINLGGFGAIVVDGEEHPLKPLDALYIGAGSHEVIFDRANGGSPAYYLASAPAHRSYPVRHVRHVDAPVEELGSRANASSRTLRKYIHPDGVCSAQLVMGYTEVPEGSVWNTLPPHTHSRRSEIYLYFDLGDGVVVHLMGEPDHSRHLVVRERQAVLSPPWSIHMGAGTGPYRFVWVMAGENQDFADIDPVPVTSLF